MSRVEGTDRETGGVERKGPQGSGEVGFAGIVRRRQNRPSLGTSWSGFLAMTLAEEAH